MCLFLARDKGADPWRVIRGVDMYGRICGRDDGVTDKKLAAYPDGDYPSYVICVDTCARTNEQDYEVDPGGTYSYSMAKKYESVEFLGYCFPSIVSGSVSIGFQTDFSGSAQTFSQAIADTYNAWILIAISGVIALIFTFFLTWVLKYCAGIIIWLSITAFIVGGGLGGYLAIKWAEDNKNSPNPDEDLQTAAYVGGGVLIAVTVIFLLIVLALFSRIRIAIEVVKEAARCILDMPLLVFFPLVPMIQFSLYVAFWIAGAVWLYSVSVLSEKATPSSVTTWDGTTQSSGGSNNNPTTSKLYSFDESFQYAGLWWLFHLLWMIQFFFYFSYLVFAGATADWYFTNRDAKGNKQRGTGPGQLSKWPIVQAFCRTLRYHLGTVAVTSLIIAIIQLIRIIVHYLEKKTRGHPPNKVQKALFCMLKCCLRCLECCMDKINKNALIWCAIYGDNFCTSACSSFALVWRNLARVAALHVVSNIILLIAKICIALLTAGICGALMIYVSYWSDVITSPIAPSIIIFILAFAVATLFMSVFHAVIDSIFLCFLVDSEANDGGEMKASRSLQKLVGKYEKQSKKIAEKENEMRSNRPGATSAVSPG